jgi:hypothetical protein
MIHKTVLQDAFVKGVMHRTTPEDRPKISLKRKVGYVEEQVSVTRAKMAGLHIDETSRPEKESESTTNELD